MGSAASLNNTSTIAEDDFDFNPDQEIDLNALEKEAENDLQQVIDYMFDSHLERISVMGDVFRRCRQTKELDAGASLPKEFILTAFRVDPLVRMLLEMPITLEEDGTMKTLKDVLVATETDASVTELTWMDVINRFKSSRVHSSHKLPHMRAVFDMIDTDKSGTVDKAELTAAMKKDPRIESFLALPARIARTETNSEEVQKDELQMIDSFMTVFDQIDNDGSKEITWDEFSNFVMWS
jgi:Ca2+-binding EF-hand superfamily protein|tara:strand:+ start:106 stop:819 length:714 start_codon:yes stop_codon:yes gene_type:complete